MRIKLSNRKKQIIKIYLLFTDLFFSLIVITIFFLAWKKGADLGTVVFVASLLLLMINATFMFGYRNALRAIDAGKKADDSLRKINDKSHSYWVIKSSLILLASTAFGAFMLFVKKMVILGAGIMVVSSIAFIYLLKKRYTKHLSEGKPEGSS